MPDTIELRVGEVAVLIRAAVGGKYVPLVYGPHFVALIWRDAEWALPILAELRGIRTDRA